MFMRYPYSHPFSLTSTNGNLLPGASGSNPNGIAALKPNVRPRDRPTAGYSRVVVNLQQHGARRAPMSGPTLGCSWEKLSTLKGLRHERRGIAPGGSLFLRLRWTVEGGLPSPFTGNLSFPISIPNGIAALKPNVRPR